MRIYVRFICLAVIVFCVITAPLAAFSSKTDNLQRSTVSVDSAEEPYILMAYRSKIGVFQGDIEEPLRVLNVYLKNLPIVDQQALRAGILVEGENKLQKLIEDLES